MNRKKIALLLTGLVVTSSMFTGCTSSSDNKTSQNNSRVAQEEPILKRASERTVTEYNQDSLNQYPDIAYSDDIIDNSIGNEMRKDMNSFSTENQFDNVQNYENSTNKNDMNLSDGNLFDTTTQDYQMNPSDEIITNDQMYNFENSTTQTPINGFSNVVEDEYYENNLNQNQVSKSSENSSNSQTKQDTQAKNSSYGMSKAPVDETKLVGQISAVKVKGSSEVVSSVPTKPQGVAEVSFKLSGDVLKAQHSSEALSTILQNAYEETRQDANNSYSGAGTTTAREKLQAALVEIFTPSDSTVKMIFRSSDGAARTIPFKATDMFPQKSTNTDYVRHIIDLDATSGQTRSARSVNPSDMVIKMLIRVGTPDGNNELKTNTNYTFVGTEGDANFKTTAVDSTKDQLVGFTIPDFKTGKISSQLEAKDDSDSVIYEAESDSAEGNKKENFYLDQATNKTYIAMKKIMDATEKIEVLGTGVRFKSIIFNDTDKTINKIEVEDDRGTKYSATLIPVEANKPESGSYLEVTGLKRDTPYVFTKIHINYKIGNENETRTIGFANYDNSLTKLQINNLPIRTAAFSGPQLALGAEHNQKVDLPGGLKVDAVKNDSTALRYIFKVDNPEGFVGDVRVNGLRAGEESKVEKIVDETSKVNYYVVTLSNLTKNTNYGFVIFEIDYKDPDGKELVGRQALGDINKSGTGVTDNTTESTELTGTQAFNVIMNESVTSKNARSTEVPVFIDDIHENFLRVDFVAPKDNPDAKVVYEDGKLKFTDLKPESNTVCKVDFVYKIGNKEEKNTTSSTTSEEKISKYIKISTPKVADLDIKTATVKAKATEAEVKFELYSEAKSPVKTVVVKEGKEKEIKSTWNKETNTLKLEGLTEKTEYKNLKVTFTLENGKTVEHTLDTFTTEAEEVKPTGKTAEFVSRVYKIALGREPEVEGWEFWIKKLDSKEISATEFIAENLMTQPEFVDRELSKRTFVTTMYSLIVNREPDEEGQKYWERKYDEYRRMTGSIEELRIKIAREMMDQPEFKELVTQLNLKY